MKYVYKKADSMTLEKIWDKNIKEHEGDKRWLKWKNEMIENNANGKALTFVILCDNEPIGEGTLLLFPQCKAIRHRKKLCDGDSIVNLNALRIQKEYENKGHISQLLKEIEKYALKNGYSYLSIGVEAKETRNLSIYLHWGFTEFIKSYKEDGELVLYYRKKLRE